MEFNMKNYLNQNIVNLKTSGIRDFARLASQKEDCINLTIGEPDFNTPQIIKEKVTEDLNENMTHYPPNNGYYFLRQSISDFERKKYGLDYHPDEIIMTCGATEALYVALTSIIQPGDEVILPTPAFLLYENIVNLNGGKCVFIDTAEDNFTISPEKLEKAITPKTKAVILNSPNNPSGAVYTENTLREIYQILNKYPIFVLCDDVYRELIYDDTPYISYGNIAKHDPRVIVIQSFSKPYSMTGWRIGYIMADSKIKSVMERLHQYNVVSIPAFVQNACAQALREDTSPMRHALSARRDFVHQRLTSMGIDILKPAGAFYFFLPTSRWASSSEEFCLKLIDKARVALTPGVFFRGEGFARLSYCCSLDVLNEAMDRLESALK